MALILICIARILVGLGLLGISMVSEIIGKQLIGIYKDPFAEGM